MTQERRDAIVGAVVLGLASLLAAGVVAVAGTIVAVGAYGVVEWIRGL